MSERIKHNFISEIAIGRRQLLITQVKQIYNIIINTDKMYRRANMCNTMLKAYRGLKQSPVTPDEPTVAIKC